MSVVFCGLLVYLVGVHIFFMWLIDRYERQLRYDVKHIRSSVRGQLGMFAYPTRVIETRHYLRHNVKF